jgi:hypothetical protein
VGKLVQLVKSNRKERNGTYAGFEISKRGRINGNRNFNSSASLSLPLIPHFLDSMDGFMSFEKSNNRSSIRLQNHTQ